MFNYKIGQKYRVIRNTVKHDLPIGSTVIVYKNRDSNTFYYRDDWYISLGDVTILEIINKTMNIKEKFALAFKSEPEKTFRKAGVTNGDDYLTDDGQKIFLSWLLKKYGVEFKKEVVDELVKEDKDENK